MFRQIDIEEVKKHKSEKSAWMIIHNEIYDVTKFLNEHPGGAEALMDFAGKDGTQGFEDVGHSQDARELMKKFKIGYLPAKERSTFLDTCRSSVGKTASTENTWRNYDGSASRRPSISSKSSSKDVEVMKAEKHVNTIVVPRERKHRPPQPISPPPSSNLKWYILALAMAIVVGISLKKYTAA